MNGVFLVGFMGSGKTTVGKLLAERLGWTFADLDDDVEAAAGMTVSGIFAARGEQEFRDIEHEALRARAQAVRDGERLVVALGGGAFVPERNVELLQACGTTVWLDAPLDVLRARVEPASHRPLAKDAAKFEELYQARREAYGKARHRIDGGGESPEATVEKIVAILGKVGDTKRSPAPFEYS
ncbi:MAG: shikimate kinase [Bryobacterales bacterium]|nr:shikimate kinase [Bryobacterales bacterium]